MHPLGGSLRQRTFQFLPSSLDRLYVHAGHLREQSVATWADPVGFHGHIPARRCSSSRREPQIHLPMQLHQD
jgi:hypothetical protein